MWQESRCSRVGDLQLRQNRKEDKMTISFYFIPNAVEPMVQRTVLFCLNSIEAIACIRTRVYRVKCSELADLRLI